MSTVFDKEMPGYRVVKTNYGDTLQVVAARELGDAARWVDIIAYNGLIPPYLTDDPSEVADGVLLTGSQLIVPAPTTVVDAAVDPEEVYEIDILLSNGRIEAADGDFAVASGRDNLRQALRHRIETERGELLFHSGYGSLVRRMVGEGNGPATSAVAAGYVKTSLKDDPRVADVTSVSAKVTGDKIEVSATVQPVSGGEVQVSTSV